jgi:hypothetical protein
MTEGSRYDWNDYRPWRRPDPPVIPVPVAVLPASCPALLDQAVIAVRAKPKLPRKTRVVLIDTSGHSVRRKVRTAQDERCGV